MLIIVVALSVALSVRSDNPGVDRAISFKDAISGALYFNSESLSWISSDSIIVETDNLVEVDVDTHNKKVVGC